MQFSPSKLVWLAVVAGASVCYWALMVRPQGKHAERGTSAEVRPPAELRSAGKSHATDVPPSKGDEASETDSLASRKAALAAAFAEASLPRKLSAVLAAAADEPTPAEQDPLWPTLVTSLAEVWRGDALSRGLDLMLAETRPRARRALVSSFALLANSERARELTATQSQTLTNDFIDLYPNLAHAQQPEVLAAIRHVAGADVADILVGKTSELEREYARALEGASRPAGQTAPVP